MITIAQPLIGARERRAVDRVLQSGQLSQGPEVAAFEIEFSAIVAGRHCVAVNSGTSALHLAFSAAGIGPGDEVIVPSFSFAATANAVALTGATPVFADIEAEHFCLDPDAAEAAITPHTRAIMPVHLYGHPAAMDRLTAVAERHGLALFEDAAQAHAAALHGRPAGAWGHAASFSFYPTKNMTTGEGGMVTTDDADLARRVRLLRNQGMEQRYANEIIGHNCRMTDVHAAIGRVQLDRLNGWTTSRRRTAAFFEANLHGVVVPKTAPGALHVFHQYTILTPGHDRDAFVRALHERGVGAAVFYPTPIHRLPSFNRHLDLPVTDEIAARCVSLPIHPALEPGEIETIADAVNAVARAGS